MNKVMIINGVNMNMLGVREPHLYGSATLKDLEDSCVKRGVKYHLKVECYQSNIEGEIVERIHCLYDSTYSALIINPGAYTHTSLAIADAISTVGIDSYEVHMTNIFSRESVRNYSYISNVVKAVVCGLGFQGYYLLIDYIASQNNNKN